MIDDRIYFQSIFLETYADILFFITVAVDLVDRSETKAKPDHKEIQEPKDPEAERGLLETKAL